jgi:hypothetical protein
MIFSYAQSNGWDYYENWMATAIISALSNGTIIMDGAFNFVENSKTGRFLANGYQHISKAEMAKTLKLAKLLMNGVLVVNCISSATSVTDDFALGRYKNGSARAAVWGMAAGFAFIPGIGWGISLGLGIADAFVGEDFYEYVEKNW